MDVIHNMRWRFIKEKHEFFDHTDYSAVVKGQRLMQLLVQDHLSTVAAEIFANKVARDMVHQSKHTEIFKTRVLYAMIGANTGVLCYVLYYAATAAKEIQICWFKAVAIWVLSDIFLTQNMYVWFFNVLVPSAIMSEIVPIRYNLADIVKQYREEKIRSHHYHHSNSEQQEFNTADHLFLSFKVAKFHPNFFESTIAHRHRLNTKKYNHTMSRLWH